MKFKFTAKSKATAEKFQKYIKADRAIESTLTEKDGKFLVEYSVAEVQFSLAKKKAKKAAKSPKPADKSKADMGSVDCGEPDYMEADDVMEMLCEFSNYFYNEMQYQMNWVWAELDYIENAFYKHVSQGHLPPINGAEKMQKALDALGIGSDYEVQKPIIYAAKSNSFEVDISAKK
jgi:hypothetical protein